MTIDLNGKRGLIMGVANERSIAWGIAKACAAAGAELAFTYQGEAFGSRLKPLAETFATLKEKWGHIDFVVHAIAFSDKNELTGRFSDTFYNVMGVAKAALESAVRYLANDLGPQGVRVNAISPGPMKTLAGAAIGGARKTYKHTDQNAPMRSNATLEAVGGTAVYLASDVGASTTGEIIRVDGGFHVLGMPQPEHL